MKYLLVLTGVLAAAGCAANPVARMPGPVSDAPVPSAAPSAPAEFAASRQIADTAALHRMAVDSIQDQKDREILEQLHDAAPAELPEVAEVSLTDLFDINVARYAEHGRVKFYLDFFQGRARERMNVWLARLPVYEPMIHEALASRGLPKDLVYLALIESGYSNTAVSRSRAVGMWQFMRPTGKEYGLRVDQWVDERRDPIKATNAAVSFLADLTKRFNGSYYLAAAAYNGGGGTVSRGLRRLGAGAEEAYFDDDDLEADLASDANGDDRFFHLSDSRYLRQETRDYVPKLIAAAMIAKQPSRYGFGPAPAVDAFAVDSVPVMEPTSFAAIAKASGVDGATIASLNPHYLRDMTPPEPGTWWIRVPSGFGSLTDSVLATFASVDRIPATTHVVKSKETLRSIGRRYGLSVEELVSYNPGLDEDSKLKTGAAIRVPGYATLRRSEPAEGSRIHVVRTGETLSGIAQRYRMGVSALRAMNELGSSNMIRTGQRLRVSGGAAPARTNNASSRAGGQTHLVRSGDTLSAIARRYGVSVSALMSANGLRSASALKAGVRIRIPG